MKTEGALKEIRGGILITHMILSINGVVAKFEMGIRTVYGHLLAPREAEGRAEDECGRGLDPPPRHGGPGV